MWRRLFVWLAAAASCSLCIVASGCSNGGSSPWSTEVDLTTAEFTSPAGSEKYMCYAETLKDPVTIQGFKYTAVPAIHHFLLARTTIPEPDGLSECNVLFRTSWIPLFGSGSSSAELDLPSDVGYKLPAGTQLVVQLHLLNTTNQDVTERATIQMFGTDNDNVRPAGLYAFGTTDISLPAHQQTDVVSDCTVDPNDTIDIFGVLPHMHYLGTKLVFEMGTSASDLHEVYRREPWSFDAQWIDPMSLTIPGGTFTRVTCSYDNTTDSTVNFGESSYDEMCFFVTFAADRNGLGGCLSSSPTGLDVPNDPSAGMCVDAQPNSLGIGGTCTNGGGECAAGLSCTADQQAGAQPGDPGYCIQIGCTSQADCGGGWATCCTPPEGGGLINICINEACRPTDCIPTSP